MGANASRQRILSQINNHAKKAWLCCLYISMSIEQVLYAELNVTSVNNYVSGRIYATDAEQNTAWPFIVYDVESTLSDVVLGRATGNVTYTVQIDVWAKSLSDRRGLESAIAAQLHVNFGMHIQLSVLENEAAEVLNTQEEGDIYHGIQTYTIIYTL